MIFSPPKRVQRSLDLLVETHPYARSGIVAKSARADSDSGIVWSKLLSAGASLDGVIRGLSKLEESLVVYGALSRLENDTLDILTSFFRLRRPERAEKLAWYCLLLTNGREDFRDLALGYIQRTGKAEMIEVAKSPQPLSSLGSVYLRSSSMLEGWSSRQVVALPILNRKFKRLLLENPHKRTTLEIEGIDTVDEWLQEVLLDSERVRWFRDYLTESETLEWPIDDPVLSRIVSRFKEPSDGGIFWLGVSGEVVQAFERWLLNLKLTDFLHEGERVQFWRHFLDRMTDAFESRDRTAVFVCFPNWFAVQFKEMGRATYMYKQEYFRRFRYLDDVSLYSALLGNNWSGRYTHQGQYWQWRAKAEVNGMFARHTA
jgi:hypothetical protein